MAHVRFSLRSLFGGVAFAAVACGALISASPRWASALWTVTVALLLVAIPVAIFRDGRRRAFAIGFLSFGWLYLAILVWPNNNRLVDSENHFLAGQLITSRLTMVAYWKVLPIFRTPANSGSSASSWIPTASAPLPPGRVAPPMLRITFVPPVAGAPPAFMPGMGGGTSGMRGGGRGVGSGAGLVGTIAVSNYPNLTDFECVGDALWTLVIAFCGGILARHLYATRKSPGPDPGIAAS